MSAALAHKYLVGDIVCVSGQDDISLPPLGPAIIMRTYDSAQSVFWSQYPGPWYSVKALEGEYADGATWSAREQNFEGGTEIT